MSNKNFEREALESLCAKLSHGGRLATIVGHPEDDHGDPLNVDSVFVIDGQHWAVEHTRIVHDPGRIAAEKEVNRVLRSALSAIGKRHGIGLAVWLYPPRRRPGNSGRPALYNSILEAAERVASTGTPVQVDMTCQVAAAGPAGEVSISFWSADQPWVYRQVEAGLVEPLERKLTGQLRSAKDAGFPVLLLLDQGDDPRSNMPPQWNALAETVAGVVRTLLDRHPGVVDEVWLRRNNGTFAHLISGTDDPRVRVGQ